MPAATLPITAALIPAPASAPSPAFSFPVKPHADLPTCSSHIQCCWQEAYICISWLERSGDGAP